MHALCFFILVALSCPTLCDPMDFSLPGSSVYGILQARILEWAAYSLLQGILLTQGLNPGLLHCRQILCCLSHKGSPEYMHWPIFFFMLFLWLQYLCSHVETTLILFFFLLVPFTIFSSSKYPLLLKVSLLPLHYWLQLCLPMLQQLPKASKCPDLYFWLMAPWSPG